MRKIVGLVLVGLGVALLGLAIALPSYVYPRIAKAPANPDQLIEAQGSGITVLLAQDENDGGIRVLENQDVTVTRKVTGEIRPDATKADGDNAFYRLAFQTQVAQQRNGLLSAYVEGGSFSGKTGLANNCCGDYLATTPTDPQGEPIRHEGLLFKFPFETEKKNYPFWDVNVKKSATAKYDGTETIKGLETYRFVQPITDVVIAQVEVPGSLMQLPDQAAVKADRVYSTVRTLWVEPRSGAIIKGSETVNQRLVYNGKQAPLIQGTITYTDKTVQTNVDKYAEAASGLRFVKQIGPIGGWVLGLILLLVGLALVLLSSRKPATWKDEEDDEGKVSAAHKQKI
ncbi:MAG TPA: DUF3068 domain-containing protein [Kineosporiaceae bacterium]|nr:DUF3068 domain-containing protein [Kineosporiaceae bacterium]